MNDKLVWISQAWNISRYFGVGSIVIGVRVGLFLAVFTVLFGQNARTPRFDKDHVLAYNADRPSQLTGGQFVSIYGWDLSPRQWCEENRNQPEPYPLELCGVRVLVGDRPAGIMYVGPLGNRSMQGEQINLQIPGDAAQSGMVPIRVCVGSNCSKPVAIAFTAQDIVLSVKEPLYTKMPVWVGVEIPMNVGFAYPFSSCPWDFGGYEFEIRREGRLIAASEKPRCQLGGRGRLFVSRAQELPVHLIHGFDEPGTYEIRLHGPILSPDGSKVVRTGYSEWTRITIAAAPGPMRAAWLSEIQGRAGNKSQWQQDGRLITSLLAWPDQAALITLKRFLPVPISQSGPHIVNGNPNYVMRCIAPNALAAFPKSWVEKLIPAERLNELAQWSSFCP